MMELKEAARDLGGVANLIEHRMSTEADALVRENSRQAAETLRRIQARLEALSRLSLEGGGERASCTNSTDAPACGAATSAACQSEVDVAPVDHERAYRFCREWLSADYEPDQHPEWRNLACAYLRLRRLGSQGRPEGAW